MTRILCVEDEPSLRRTLGANLKARGYEVDLVADGTQALAMASNLRPDLIILDLGLPDMSGIDVINSLRHWTATPIIVLSARDTELDKVAALDAGADDYVTKPFGMGELLARLRATLRRHAPSTDEPIVVTKQRSPLGPARTARFDPAAGDYLPWLRWSRVAGGHIDGARCAG